RSHLHREDVPLPFEFNRDRGSVAGPVTAPLPFFFSVAGVESEQLPSAIISDVDDHGASVNHGRPSGPGEHVRYIHRAEIPPPDQLASLRVEAGQDGRDAKRIQPAAE